MRRGVALLAALALLLAGVQGSTAAAAERPGSSALKPPGSVKAGLRTTSTLEITWSDRSAERSFELAVAPGGGTLETKRNAEGATVAGLEPNRRYTARVRACKGAKCSRWTKRKRIATKPLPAALPAFGFNEPLRPGDPANSLIAGAGASFVRVPISWARTEPLPGVVNWPYMDAVAAELEADGIRPLWVLTGSPCWARLEIGCETGGLDKSPDPLFYGAYAEMVTKIAERFPDSRGIQVWNEPNIPNFWAPKPSATEYRKLLLETASAMGSSGSDVPLVFGAPSPTDAADAARDPLKIPATSFLRDSLKGGVPGLDAVAVHPYAFNRPGDQVANGLAIYDAQEAVIDSVTPSLPVWVTEIGFTTDSGFRISEEEQAAALAATYEGLVARGVPLISVHRLFDQPDSTLAFERGMGVVEADRATVKPGYCALAVLRRSSPEACG